MLHLEGLGRSCALIDAHLHVKKAFSTSSSEEKRRNFLPRECFARLSSLQILFVTLDTLITQTLRGLVTMTSAVLTLNRSFFWLGCRDLVSALVQSLILPFIALITVMHPTTAIKVARLIETEWSSPFSFPEKEGITATCTATLLRVTAIPLSLLRVALSLPIHLLSSGSGMGNLSDVAGAWLIDLACLVALLIEEPLLSLGRLFIDRDLDSSLKVYQPSFLDNDIGEEVCCFLLDSEPQTPDSTIDGLKGGMNKSG